MGIAAAQDPALPSPLVRDRAPVAVSAWLTALQYRQRAHFSGPAMPATVDGTRLGVDIISMRGDDLLQDAIDVGQQVIPIVRAR